MASVYKRSNCKRHHFDFIDGRGMSRTLLGYRDKTATKELAGKVEKAVAIRQSGGILAGEMLSWLEGLPGDMRDRLAEWNVIDPQRAAAGKTLVEHVEEWAEHKAAKGDCSEHVKISKAKAIKMIEGCKWRFISDVTTTSAQRWLADKKSGGAAPRTVNHYPTWEIMDPLRSGLDSRHSKGFEKDSKNYSKFSGCFDCTIMNKNSIEAYRTGGN